MDVDAVLLEAWYEIRAKWPYLLVALLPVAVIAVVLDRFFGEQGPFEPFAPVPVMVLLLAAAHALFALVCHRIILLGPERLRHGSEWLPWRQYVVFLLVVLALDGLMVVALWSYAHLLMRVQSLLSFENQAWIFLLVSFLVGVVAAFYVSTRASLSLPAAAIGRLTSPTAIWRWSRGNGWRLAGTVFASLLLAWLIWGVLYLALTLTSLPADRPSVQLLAGVTNFLPVPYVVAVLSCAYRALAPGSGPIPSHERIGT